MINDARWQDLQKNLGPHGRLGIAARLFTSDRRPYADIAFNADQKFPMASIAKIPIAMLASERIAERELSLDEQMDVDSLSLSPGLAKSPLDHLFYVPFKLRRAESIGKLMGFMIHNSDNTSTDLLLQRLGGMDAISAFLERLNIKGMHMKRRFAELIANYYTLKLPLGRRPHLGQIVAAIRRLRNPYVCREEREDALILSGEDCCTPRSMVDLLCALFQNPSYDVAFSYMDNCAGGLNRIRKGLSEQTSVIHRFGHKTGSLGGIANDAGIVQFLDGSVAAICIMTCRSSAPMTIRDEQIAAATRTIITEAARHVVDPASESR